MFTFCDTTPLFIASAAASKETSCTRCFIASFNVLLFFATSFNAFAPALTTRFDAALPTHTAVCFTIGAARRKAGTATRKRVLNRPPNPWPR